MAACLLLAACASLTPAGYKDPAISGLPPRVELESVPFHAQDKYQCGPATLAMALGSAGVERRPESLRDEVYLPRRNGSLQPELLAATRRAGLLPYPLEAKPESLLAEVAAGNPVVVLQDMGLLPLRSRWHYALVVGYDLGTGEVILRSGPEKRLVMGISDFDRTWARAGRWAFVALPPARLPATAREDEFLAAAAALERVSPGAARQAYGAALDAWPANLTARLGLGNVAYRLRDLERARTAYQEATREHPESGDAWNNLAQVLHELGHGPQALAAARRAVALGGPRQKTYETTLSGIKGLAAASPAH